MSDIKSILADAEDLLKQAANATSERVSELHETALARLQQAKEKAAGVQVIVVEKSRKAAHRRHQILECFWNIQRDHQQCQCKSEDGVTE